MACQRVVWFSAEHLRKRAILNAGKTEHESYMPAKSLQSGSKRISVYLGASDSVGEMNFSKFAEIWIGYHKKAWHLNVESNAHHKQF